VVTTKERAILFKAMSDNSDTACRTGWSERMDRALEAVVRMGLPVFRHLEGLIIVVSAGFAFGHKHHYPLLLWKRGPLI
jgi:hypothetical protein